MFEIDQTTKKISITRGDYALITITAKNKDNTDYEFQKGDVIRFKVFQKKNCKNVFFFFFFEVDIAKTEVDIELLPEDTKIGELINSQVTYWYEVELNPNGKTQTIIGYEKGNEKLFVLNPEGGDKE